MEDMIIDEKCGNSYAGKREINEGRNFRGFGYVIVCCWKPGSWITAGIRIEWNSASTLWKKILFLGSVLILGENGIHYNIGKYGLMKYVRSAAKKIVLRELVYV